ncbi:MAG: S8 family serine peptidase, partial [Bacteroidota bacterium]
MVLTNYYKSILLFFICLCLSLPSFAQKKGRYLVYFKDKKNSPYSFKQAEAFLSARSLQRRLKQEIQVNAQDLPVNPSYLKGIQDKNVKVQGASRWLNAALVEADESQLAGLESLDYVWKISDLLINRKAQEGSNMNTNIYKDPEGEPPSLSINDLPDYGKAKPQVQMLGADQMHKDGYRGQGMLIAVLDAGFIKVDELSFFRHLFENGRIKDAYDFVEYDNNPYHGSEHGLMVLSTIAAYKPGEIIGTAPEADFLLYRTEDSSTEFRIEEVNWLMAAERADSAGVDVI